MRKTISLLTAFSLFGLLQSSKSWGEPVGPKIFEAAHLDEMVAGRPARNVVLVDLEERIQKSFHGNEKVTGIVQNVGNQFIDLALAGMLDKEPLEAQAARLTVLRSHFDVFPESTRKKGRDYIVSGYGRVVSLLDGKGLSHQLRGFQRGALPTLLALSRSVSQDNPIELLLRSKKQDFQNAYQGESNSRLLLATSGIFMPFPVCEAGQKGMGCADIGKLIDARNDPRSLFGRCADGDMVANGPLSLESAGTTIYGCKPGADICGSDNPSDGPQGKGWMRGLSSLFKGSFSIKRDSNSSSSQTVDTGGLSQKEKKEVCEAHEALGVASAEETADCIGKAIAAKKSTDRKAASGIGACLVERLGLGSDTVSIGEGTQSMLKDNQCGLGDGAYVTKPDGTRVWVGEDGTEYKTTTAGPSANINRGEAAGAVTADGTTIVNTGNGYKVTSNSGDLTVEAKIGRRGRINVEVKPKAGEVRLYDYSEVEEAVGTDEAKRTGLPEAMARAIKDAVEKAADRYQASKAYRERQGYQECGSLDNCTCNEAVQEINAAVDDCIDEQLQGAMTPEGRPVQRDFVAGDGIRDPRTERPRDDAVDQSHLSQDPIGDCMSLTGGAAPAGGVWTAGGVCAFVVCDDGSSNCCRGFASSAVSAQLLHTLKLQKDCSTLHCIEGQPCECAGESSEVSPGSPGPRPGGPVDHSISR